MRISDWSSDVCSSDLIVKRRAREGYSVHAGQPGAEKLASLFAEVEAVDGAIVARGRSEEHTSELQSLMRISYAVFCLKKKNNIKMYTRSICAPNNAQ